VPVKNKPYVSSDRVRILEETVLSDNWYLLKKARIDYLRRDGRWQEQVRESYDRGNGAVVLLFNVEQGTVVLIRQFRFPTYVNGNADGLLIEACAGLLDGQDPLTCIRKEAEEETGFRVNAPRKVFEAYMSPGSVTELIHFFVAEYSSADRVTTGGGDVSEGEDIEVLEMPLTQAMQMVKDGAIKDGKTIILLQLAALLGLEGLRSEAGASRRRA
jgi:nudix-type nucleoside diphosphatase (YffH/AdpP family)